MLRRQLLNTDAAGDLDNKRDSSLGTRQRLLEMLHCSALRRREVAGRESRRQAGSADPPTMGPIWTASSALLSTSARQARHAPAKARDRHRRAARSNASRRSCSRACTPDHARHASPSSLCVHAPMASSSCAAPSRLHHDHEHAFCTGLRDHMMVETLDPAGRTFCFHPVQYKPNTSLVDTW